MRSLLQWIGVGLLLLLLVLAARAGRAQDLSAVAEPPPECITGLPDLRTSSYGYPDGTAPWQ